MLELHFAPGTIAGAVAIALNEAGLPHILTPISFAEGEQHSAAFRALNPKGRVPALVTPRGCLTETGAILEYIAALAPEVGMMPADPFDAARVRAMVHYLAATMHVNHAHSRRGSRWADHQSSFDDMAAKVPRTMAESCAFVESEIEGPLLFGETLSIADAHLYTITTWLGADGVDIAAYPRLAHLAQQMRARPSVQAAYDAGVLKDT